MNVVSLIFISGILTAGHWFFIYDHGEHIISETERLRQEIIKSDKEIIDKKDELQKLVAFDNSVKKMGQEMQAFLNYIPETLNSRILFEDLIKVAETSEVDVKNINNAPAKKETDLYETLAINMILEGKFSNFLIFLSGLTELDKMIVIRNVILRPVPEKKGQESSLQKITAQLDLISFRYLNPSALQDKKS